MVNVNYRIVIRPLTIIVAIIFFLFCLSPFISLLSSKKYRNRAYIDLTYRVIANKEARLAKSKEDIILRFFDYANRHIFVPERSVPGEANLLDYLVTGVGWCDHQANVFNKLLSKKDIPARYVYLKDKEGVSPHTVSEVYFNNRWVIFDPQDYLYFKLDDGNYATLNDISQRPQIILSHVKLKSLETTDKDAYEGSKVFWQRLFPLPMEPERSAPWTERNSIFTEILDLYVTCFGKRFINAYQDIYLRLTLAPIKQIDYRLFFAARNYQIYYRRDLAIDRYMSLIKNYPESKYSDDGLFFLALLYIDIDHDYEMAKDTFHKLIVSYPGSEWLSIARNKIKELDKN
jgi:hypothetical protein